MTTKSFDAALDFLPEAKPAAAVRKPSLLRTLVESFNEARRAETAYRELTARGVSHEVAARKAFGIITNA